MRPDLGDHLGLWQLTDDPTVRDHANHHSLKCWSPDGRYVAYTHWGQNKKQVSGSLKAATIHLYDLHRREEKLVDRGIFPRWANTKNWLFYTRYRPRQGKLCQDGTELIWFDVNRESKRSLSLGFERLGETDHMDRWIYGKRRSCEPPWTYTTVRAAISQRSEVDVLESISGSRPMPNPLHPVLYIRQDNKNTPFDATRLWFDIDGGKQKIFVPMVQKSHMSWLGNGAYLLLGDGLIRGRRWDEPYPSNMHILSSGRVGDVSACGRSGRYACGDSIIADLRSGDAWQYINPLSMIAFPKGAGDISHISDPDPKGSPDGTKVCFVSNYPLADGPVTRLKKSVRVDDTSIAVESTSGFPPTGSLLIHTEVIGYGSKTRTQFLQLSRGLYNTRIRRTGRGRLIKSFDAACIGKPQLNAGYVPPRIMTKRISDPDSPLLHQRQTDIYVAIVRRPDRPWLQASTSGGLNLIPGESHYETYGYHILKNDKLITKVPVRPDETFPLESSGQYTAVAVEWSGLKSLPSAQVTIEKPLTLQVLNHVPGEFEWTEDVWRVEDKVVSADKAPAASKSVKDIIHRYDGLIHRELYQNGKLIQRTDYNLQKQPIRIVKYRNGQPAERRHLNRKGQLVSLENFASDGYIIESIYYRYPNDKRQIIYDQWFYEKGGPVKRISKEKNVFIKKDENCVLTQP
jgi:hypothetical protein